MTQIKTRFVTLNSVMRSAAFMRGVNEMRKGLPMDYDAYNEAHEGSQRWNYERGRQFAIIFAGNVKQGGKVTYEAVRAYQIARLNKHVL